MKTSKTSLFSPPDYYLLLLCEANRISIPNVKKFKVEK